MRYKIYYQPVNAPTLPDTLLEARLPDHLTHSGGGCWIAYRKYTIWATHVRPLRLPTDCPFATTCAVIITLHPGAKAAIIARRLLQPVDEHERACQTLARLPRTLPHHLLILGGDLQGGWTSSMPKDAHVQSLPFLRWVGVETPTFTPPHQPNLATCIDHLTIWDPRHLADQIGGTISLRTSILDYKGVLRDHTSPGPYRGSHCSFTRQDTSCP